MKHKCLQWQLRGYWDDLRVATCLLLSQRKGRRRRRQGGYGCFVRGVGLHLGRTRLSEAQHPLFHAQIAGICRPLVEAGWWVCPSLSRACKGIGGAAEEVAD